MKYDVDYWFQKKQTLYENYKINSPSYTRLLEKLIIQFEKLLKDNNINGSVKGRVKSFEAFHKKLLIRCQKEKIKDPLKSITDIIGLRIVVPFLEDVDLVEKLLEKNYNVIEIEHKSQSLSIREFGYDSTHYLIEFRYTYLKPESKEAEENISAEIQLRTTLQDAWAEVEHELIYKANIDKVEDSIRRKLTAINATLSLADITFQEIRDFHNTKFKELQIKHKSLLDKVSTIPEKKGIRSFDEEMKKMAESPSQPESDNSFNIDTNSKVNNMFMEAINAHVDGDFKRAIDLYTQLLAISSNHYLYNHRGIVYIAISEYKKAIDDFTKAIELEPNDTRVYTNRGLAYRMIQKFDRALDDFNKSLELNPLWPDTLYGRALTYQELGDIKNALEDCEKAISLKPDFKQALRLKQFLLNVNLE